MEHWLFVDIHVKSSCAHELCFERVLRLCAASPEGWEGPGVLYISRPRGSRCSTVSGSCCDKSHSNECSRIVSLLKVDVTQSVNMDATRVGL